MGLLGDIDLFLLKLHGLKTAFESFHVIRPNMLEVRAQTARGGVLALGKDG